MIDQSTQDQLDRIEREQAEIKDLLSQLVCRGVDVSGVSVLQEASINDLARDFGKRGAVAFTDHNRKRRNQSRQ